MPEQSNDYRVVVFGAGGVGKTSLVLRFINGTFRDSYIPTIEDTYRKVHRVEGQKKQPLFWPLILGDLVKQVDMHLAHHRYHGVAPISGHAEVIYFQRSRIHPGLFHLLQTKS